MAELGWNNHGKGLVRFVKVRRSSEKDESYHYTVQTLLEGPMTAVFVKGDNSPIIATDTQKNTVYALAEKTEFTCAEEYALALCRHFLTEYPQFVTKCTINVQEEIWERLVVPDSRGQMRDHHHAFKKRGPETFTCEVVGEAGPNKMRPPTFALASGVKSLTLLKTTQSAFKDFYRDGYTQLPEVDDRLVATAVDATWRYSHAQPQGANHRATNAAILNALITQFSGPADAGVYSPSVQATAYDMGAEALRVAPAVKDIKLYLPNIHNIPFDFSRLNCGATNRDPRSSAGKEPFVFVATSEPHGIIECVVQRSEGATYRSKL